MIEIKGLYLIFFLMKQDQKGNSCDNILNTIKRVLVCHTRFVLHILFMYKMWKANQGWRISTLLYGLMVTLSLPLIPQFSFQIFKHILPYDGSVLIQTIMLMATNNTWTSKIVDHSDSWIVLKMRTTTAHHQIVWISEFYFVKLSLLSLSLFPSER